MKLIALLPAIALVAIPAMALDCNTTLFENQKWPVSKKEIGVESGKIRKLAVDPNFSIMAVEGPNSVAVFLLSSTDNGIIRVQNDGQLSYTDWTFKNFATGEVNKEMSRTVIVDCKK